jgi:hypothetical protein
VTAVGYDTRKVLRVPGRFAYGCTDLTLAWPHGGTGLGVVKQVAWTERGAPYPLTLEAMGGEPVEYLEPGVDAFFAFILRTNDDNAISKVFRNTAAGTVSQRRVVTEPGTVRAGNWMSGRAVSPLVFTPEGSTHAWSRTTPDVDAPFFVLYNAIPHKREDLEIPLERTDEWAIGTTWHGIRDSSSRVYARGARKDLTL